MLVSVAGAAAGGDAAAVRMGSRIGGKTAGKQLAECIGEVVVISIAGGFDEWREAVRAGRVPCPDCGAPLSRRGFAPPLTAVRGAGHHVAGLGPGGERIRTWCRHCRRGHTLLPAALAARRADLAAVLGCAVAAHAEDGMTAGQIAAGLGVPRRTVAGWLAQARAFAAAHLQAFTALLAGLAAWPGWSPAFSFRGPVRELLAILRAVTRAAADRWGDLGAGERERINLICRGRLLSGSLRLPVYLEPASPAGA